MTGKEIEKTITEQMITCPCCGAKGVCEFLFQHSDIYHFYVGCSDKNCGVNVDRFKFSTDNSKEERTNKTKIRTPEEMLKIWNTRV